MEVDNHEKLLYVSKQVNIYLKNFLTLDNANYCENVRVNKQFFVDG